DYHTNCWITGYFASTNDFRTNLLVACVNATGQLVGMTQGGGTGASLATGIASYQGYHKWICGSFTTNVQVGGVSLTNNGNADVLLARIAPTAPAVKTSVTNNSLILTWPSSQITYTLEEAVSPGSTNWTVSTNPISVQNGAFVVTN